MTSSPRDPRPGGFPETVTQSGPRIRERVRLRSKNIIADMYTGCRHFLGVNMPVNGTTRDDAYWARCDGCGESFRRPHGNALVTRPDKHQLVRELRRERWRVTANGEVYCLLDSIAPLTSGSSDSK